MSALFTFTLVLHVVVAVLGLGSIVSIAIVARMARNTKRAPGEVLPWLAPLLRLSAFSLAAMLATGVVLDFAARGAFHELWWFRGSALLLIAVGALHGAARRTVRSGFGKTNAGSIVFQRLARIAYAMCAIIAGIVPNNCYPAAQTGPIVSNPRLVPPSEDVL